MPKPASAPAASRPAATCASPRRPASGAATWRRWCRGFLQQHPEVSLSLNLSDRVVDIVNEGFDCAVRVGDLPDSSLVSVRLADNRRLCVATPAYLKRAGTPHAPGRPGAPRVPDAVSSDASQTRGWAFLVDGEVTHLRPSGRLDCSDGQVLHDWCLHGLGIAWRSTWEVEREVAERPAGGAAGGLCRAAQRHLRGVPAAQAPAAAGAAVDRLPQAQLRRPGLLAARRPRRS